MSELVLDINDIGLAVSDGGKTLLSSPACAVLNGNKIAIGKEAFQRSRLRPLWTNSRFWSRLNQEKLANPSGRFQTNADLAHAHLEHIWHKLAGRADSGLLIVVPGTWNQEQMGLLLGITADLKIPVRGMIDSAVAAGVSLEPLLPCLHLDLQQGKFVLTEMQGGTQLSRSGVFVVCETGLSAIRDAWANIIADVFVRQTRFDPMHKAETEQQLFNKLGGWLAEIESSGSAALEMDAGDKTYTVQLAGDQLLPASLSVYPQIVQQIRPRAKGILALSHRLADFPGLKDSLALIAGLELKWLDENAAARGALAKSGVYRNEPDAQDVTFLTSLPLSAESSSENAPVAHDLLHGVGRHARLGQPRRRRRTQGVKVNDPAAGVGRRQDIGGGALVPFGRRGPDRDPRGTGVGQVEPQHSRRVQAAGRTQRRAAGVGPGDSGAQPGCPQ